MTIDWKLAGMPRCWSLPVRSDLSCELTSAPSTATPVTAPISRLVLLVADAAMPERSGGTAVRTEEVIGTTVIPMPRPVRASAAASGRYRGCGLRLKLVSGRRAEDQAARGDQDPEIDHALPAADQDRGGDHQHRHRQEHPGDTVTGIADHLRQVQRGKEEDREGREVGAERDDIGGGSFRARRRSHAVQPGRLRGSTILDAVGKFRQSAFADGYLREHVSVLYRLGDQSERRCGGIARMGAENAVDQRNRRAEWPQGDEPSADPGPFAL